MWNFKIYHHVVACCQLALLFAVSMCIHVSAHDSVNGQEFTFDLPETLPYPEYVERVISGYPESLYAGDIFYLKISQKNITNTPFVTCSDPFVEPLSRQNVLICITSDVTDEEFFYYPAGISDLPFTFASYELEIQPGYSLTVCYPMEMPSQESMQHPFWKSIMEKMGPDGIVCKITVMLTNSFVRFPERYTRNIFPPQRDDFDSDRGIVHVTSHHIRIRPRLEQEQWILVKWMEASQPLECPETVVGYPINDVIWYRASVHRYHPNQNASDGPETMLGRLRYTYSRPPTEGYLATSDEWKNLEEYFASSTLRDEIHWCRMLLDYYHTSNPEDRVLKRRALAEWIDSLPTSQQMAFASELAVSLSPSYNEHSPEIHNQTSELMKMFYSRMTSESQWRIYAKSREYPPPFGEGDGNIKVFHEILDPPEYYMNLRKNNQHSTDGEGFRLWKFGIYYIIAKYEGKTEFEKIILTNKYSFSMHVPVAEFEKDDLEYIEFLK